jgi:hypothetical protein
MGQKVTKSRIRNTAFYSEKCRGYFTPVLFAKLQQGDRLGRVSIMALFNYVMRKVWLHQTRIGLSLYDITGQGFLRESDLGKYYILKKSGTLYRMIPLIKKAHRWFCETAKLPLQFSTIIAHWYLFFYIYCKNIGKQSKSIIFHIFSK